MRKTRRAAVRPARLWLWAPILLVSCGAGPRPPVRTVPEPPAREVEATVLLVGDAGDPDPKGEPILTALTRELARDPARSLAVFLGDNLYPRGLPEPSHPDRAEGERRLSAQVDAVRASGARGLFIPGNHDWDRQGKDGWAAVRRQAEYVLSRGGPSISFLPTGGCPGPAVVDVTSHLRLVVLDTQWWLHKGPKPLDPTSSCAADSEGEVLESLREVLRTAGDRRLALLAHHPLASGGTHGGHFDWKDHLFPLRAWKRWLWVPLPVVGSAYPLARKWGIFGQDLRAAGYARMRGAIEGALAEHPPLVWASGHDHSLQVLTGRSARYLLVSGAGIYGHTRAPAWTDATRFASGEAGFMRLDVDLSGRVRLGVLAVDRRGRAEERFSTWLE